VTQDETKPTIDERYTSATNTSTMKMETERSMPIDVLTAAGWSQSRIGAAVLRLHSEFDAVEKPIRPTPARIAALVGTSQSVIKDLKADRDKQGRLTQAGARSYAHAWYRHEVGILLGRLKTLPALRELLALQCEKEWGWEEPRDKSVAVLIWWLDQTCPHCNGLKFQKVEGAPALSHKPCRRPPDGCGGTGLARAPYGQEGMRLANWIDQCVQLARTQISKALHGRRNPA
jgi:hypothetical protein